VSSVYVLLVLVPLCVVVYVLWAYRRKAQQRDAANAERLHDVIGLAARAARGQGNATPEHASGGLQDSDSHALVSYIKRDRLLTAPQTLLYYMLKNELPDNLVFAEMPLSSEAGRAASSADTAAGCGVAAVAVVGEVAVVAGAVDPTGAAGAAPAAAA